MFDRDILLVPAIDGYEQQAVTRASLAPFTNRPVRMAAVGGLAAPGLP
jgi:hypothetical protein